MKKFEKELLDFLSNPTNIRRDEEAWFKRVIDYAGLNFNEINQGEGSIKDRWYYIIGHAVIQDKIPELIKEIISQSSLDESNPIRQKLESFISQWEQERNITKEALEPVQPTLEDTLSRLQREYRDSGKFNPSRTPIIIAIEDLENPIDEKSLLKTERHISVGLNLDQIEELEALSDCLTKDDCSFDKIIYNGELCWSILKKTQPRLRALVESAYQSQDPQPIAWTGRQDLLSRIFPAILMAKIGRDDALDDFISIGYGDHYFHPLSKEGKNRSMRGRENKEEIEFLEIDFTEKQESEAQRTPILPKASRAELVIINASAAPSDVLEFTDFISRQPTGTTRLLLSFNDYAISDHLINGVLEFIPCFGIANPVLGKKEIIRAISKIAQIKADVWAPNCIIGAVRSSILNVAFREKDLTLFRYALQWSCWSTFGRPLFAGDFGELTPATYPHLMDLRSVASKDWYYNRSKDVQEEYQVDNFFSQDQRPEEKFHFYLTGAGGTGKSCFLKYIYENLIERPDVLAVWYRVDAPSSDWSNVQKRLKEEIAKIFINKTGQHIKSVHPGNEDLRFYLKNLIAAFRDSNFKIQEIVVFIDQLERTFESGDNPEFHRLEKISSEIIMMLKEIGVGKGIRIFIASRKQYLPDFLGSFIKANNHGLHFNVLQKITDTDRISFVEKILKWCIDKKLIDESITFDLSASEELGRKLNGHPLNMMLALIQIFSQDGKGEITREYLEKLRPWENLFQLDIQLAAKDDIEWYFLLAMAHTRTEIVRFDEVWWRLRLVDPILTRRAQELRREGILERLWLLGHLGRTIYPRPEGNDKAKFLEFFHANLRDYLISDVLNYAGTEVQGSGKKGGTPPVWRALDRLSSAAHDWEQTMQPLPPEDIKAMVDHWDVVVEKIQKDDKSYADYFHLLFLRNADNLRKDLCEAAKECFVFSAIIHDEYGRKAFAEIFPDKSRRVYCIKKWLSKCALQDRIRLFQYLVELQDDTAYTYLCELIWAASGGIYPESYWQEIASVLAEPLYGTRYRSSLVVALIKNMPIQQGVNNFAELPKPFGEFCAVACDRDRESIIQLLSECKERIVASNDQKLSQMVNLLSAGQVDEWLKSVQEAGLNPGLNTRELQGRIPPVIQLILGPKLETIITDQALSRWHSTLVDRFGLSFPTIQFSNGELEDFQLELRLKGHRIALGFFFPEMLQTLKRHWVGIEPAPAARIFAVENEALAESVLWVEAAELDRLRWNKPKWTAEEAILDWLDKLLRNNFYNILDLDGINHFLEEISEDINVPQLLMSIGGNISALRTILIDMIRESIPLRDRKIDLMNELQQFLSQINQSRIHPNIVSQKLREYIGEDICKSIARESEQGQLSVILLDEGMENQMKSKLISNTDGFQRLNLDPAEALSITSALSTTFARVVGEKNVLPVLVCEPALRFYLFNLLQKFDPRIRVLSLTELSPEVVIHLEAVLSDAVTLSN